MVDEDQLPAGRSTRIISSTAASWSGMAHKLNVHTTVSNEASANGNAWALSCRSEMARPRSRARDRA